MHALKDPGVSNLGLTGIIAGSLRGLVTAGARETSSGLSWGGDLMECQENGSKEPREGIEPFPGLACGTP